MPDWNKEIKLSDLFKRREKAPKEAPADVLPVSEAVAVPEPAAPKQSFLKKEISFSRRRKEKAPKEASADVSPVPEPVAEQASEAVAVPESAAVVPEPAAPKQSFLKKEISFSRRRKEKSPREPQERKPSRAERRAAKKAERTTAQEAKPTRAERRATKRAEREVAKAEKAAEKAARKAAPKEPRRSRKQVPPVPAVPIMRAFNLLPREDARDARGRRPSSAQLVLAVVALVAFAALGAYFLMLNAQVADKRSEADALRAAAAARPSPTPAPAPDDQADAALQQEQQARTAALAGALGRRVAWDRLLRDFSLVMPDGVSLTKLSASGGGSAGATDQPPPPGTPAPESVFTIEGYTKSQETVALVLARLSVLPELASVRLQSSTETELSGEKVFQFVITTTAKPPSGSTL
jgi:Tfp pilus assembly protein PilN